MSFPAAGGGGISPAKTSLHRSVLPAKKQEEKKKKKSKTDFTALVGLTMQMYSGPLGHFFTVFINAANLPQCHLPRPPSPSPGSSVLGKAPRPAPPSTVLGPTADGDGSKVPGRARTHTCWGFVPSQEDKIKHCHSACPSQTRRGTRSALKPKQTLFQQWKTL